MTAPSPAPGLAPFSSRPAEAVALEAYFDRLWPLLRSITGAGVRETLEILAEILPLQCTEIPSGTRVFDWTVPEEWNCRDAYVLDGDGRKVINVKDNTLHILNYSSGFDGVVGFHELDQHLYSLPDQPDAIPYVTSYYARRWGFCMRHRERERLDRRASYTVHIDAEHVNGSLTVADAVLRGETDREVLISTYVCHPSMANNELSGPLVAAYLFRELQTLRRRRFTYRFVFVPETIGAIAYLSLHGDHLKSTVDAGLVLTCVGDRGPFTYKRSRRGQSLIDRAAENVLGTMAPDSHRVVDFFPAGSDERQYCSPGFDLPVGSLMRTMYNRFPEYHTSLDNKDFISFDALLESVRIAKAIIESLEGNITYTRPMPHCEIKLDRYGLYSDLSIKTDESAGGVGQATRWLLAYADGRHDLIDISNKSGIPVQSLVVCAEHLEALGLVIDAGSPAGGAQ